SPPRDPAHYVDANALAVSGLLAAARALDEPSWKEAALASLARITEACFTASAIRVAHRLGAEHPELDLHLGDHGALGRAFVAAHVATGDPRHLARAEALAAALLTTFRDSRSGALYDTAPDGLVNRAFWPEQPIEDTVGVSSLAMAIGLLNDLSRLTGRAHYHAAAGQALRCALSAAAEDPLGSASYHLALAEWGETP